MHIQIMVPLSSFLILKILPRKVIEIFFSFLLFEWRFDKRFCKNQNSQCLSKNQKIWQHQVYIPMTRYSYWLWKGRINSQRTHYFLLISDTWKIPNALIYISCLCTTLSTLKTTEFTYSAWLLVSLLCKFFPLIHLLNIKVS